MNILKVALIFAAGAGVGAGVTYLIMKDRTPVELSDSERDEMIGRETQKDAIEMSADELRDFYIQGLRDLGFGIEERFDDDEEESSRKSRVNPLDEDEEEYEDDSDPAPVDPNPFPYEISTAEFGDRGEEWSADTLSWYREDQVMTDDDNDPIDDWEKHVGFNGCEKTLNNTNADAVYVRNEVEMCDYEILIFNDSYSHSVLGMDEEAGDMAD